MKADSISSPGHTKSEKPGPFRVNPILTGGGGKMVPLRAFAKYLKNGLTDLHEAL